MTTAITGISRRKARKQYVQSKAAVSLPPTNMNRSAPNATNVAFRPMSRARSSISK